jgi:hypothetical protein
MNPKIDIAFHNVLISAFWGFFSESDTDIQSASAGELLYPIGICARRNILQIKISFGTH